jgi:multiple sugar transport system permease protein
MRDSTRSAIAGYVLSTPYILFLLAFGIGPTAYALYVALTTQVGAFAGFDNFIHVFQDFRFGPAVVNVAAFMVCWLPFMVLVVLGVSLMLHARRGRIEGALRVLYYLPGGFTGAAAILLWIFILDPNIGPFRDILSLTGATYLSDIVTPERLPIIFAVITFTTGAGSWIVIMYGALTSIGEEVEEAARMDGVNSLQMAWHIQLPLMRKYIVYMVIMCFASGLQIFIEPQLLQDALPQTVNPTWSLNELAVTGWIAQGQLGQSAALSVIMLVIGVIAALILIFRTNFFDRERKNA